jgi:CP family cyanate transporter-like MFS transporter
VSTGIYASGLASGGIVGAFLSALIVARGEAAGDWRAPIALWGIVAALSLLVWLAVLRPWRAPEPASADTPDATVSPMRWSPWTDSGAWVTALLCAAQGIVYYLLVAWLPAIYGEAGVSAAAMAVLVTVFNASTLPGMLVFPSWSDRLGRRRPPAIAAGVFVLIGVVGLMALPLAGPLRWLWPALAGSGVAGVFAMTLVLPADIAPSGHTGAAAGMVLAIGYVASALGPVIAGVVHDATGSFAAALTMLPVIGVAIIVCAALVPELRCGSRVE